MDSSIITLVDTHCHLDAYAFVADLDEVMTRAVAAGVTRVIVPALDLNSAQTILSLADEYEGLYAAVGVHPNSAAAWRDEWIGDLGALAAHPQVVAIGEIGLDYYWDKTPSATQHLAFARQLELAAELGLPVIVHNRDASADVLRLLAESPLGDTGRPGVLHSFSADWATAEKALALGFYLGFTGPLTYKKADELRVIAARVPLDRILIETDSPYLSPEPHRGRRNEPAHVRLVAERLAELRGLSLEQIGEVTTTNAERLFGLGIREESTDFTDDTD